jgi:hypothetical protein
MPEVDWRRSLSSARLQYFQNGRRNSQPKQPFPLKPHHTLQRRQIAWSNSRRTLSFPTDHRLTFFSVVLTAEHIHFVKALCTLHQQSSTTLLSSHLITNSSSHNRNHGSSCCFCALQWRQALISRRPLNDSHLPRRNEQP